MATTKLTDTHLVILSHASQQENGRVLPLPGTDPNPAGARKRTLNALLRRNLIAEVGAVPGDTEWRRDEDGSPLTLTITETGLAAIGLGSGPDQGACNPASSDTGERSAAKAAAGGPKTFRTGSKGAAIVRLLKRKTGATLPDLMAASGWQAHSVRGFLSGTLKTKHGLTVASEKTEAGVRRYRIPA